MLAGGHEIANVEAHVDELAGGPHTVPFDLGALGTAWPRVRAARSITEVRAALAQSPWGDPGIEPGGSVRCRVAHRVGAADHRTDP